MAEPPRSAIPWLSESLQNPQTTVELPAHTVTIIPPGGNNNVIETSSLDAPIRDGVGILTRRQTGFPSDLWGQTSALRVRNYILEHPGTGVPATKALFHALLLAEATPPHGSNAHNIVLLARIDRLMDDGLLEQAEALVGLAGITNPPMFRRAFDIGLLTERSESVCETLRGSPALSPTLPARIFCMARQGDWDAAALTLKLGLEIGEISPAQEAILARFLDPQLFEDTPPPPIPDPLTTLDFVLRDAVALPRPSGALPLAFEYLDAAEHAPIRSRTEAGERLVRAGAMPSSLLFATYRAGKPASSGGIWDHAAAIQALDKALANGEITSIAKTLSDADILFSNNDLRLALARDVAARLIKLDPTTFDNETRHSIYALLMLNEDWSAARGFMANNNDVADRFFRALAEPGTSFPAGSSLGALRAAAARGLTRPDAPTETAALIANLLDEGDTGEGLLRTLEVLQAGVEIDPRDLEAGLWLLRRAGLSGQARNIATQTLLLLPEA